MANPSPILTSRFFFEMTAKKNVKEQQTFLECEALETRCDDSANRHYQEENMEKFGSAPLYPYFFSKNSFALPSRGKRINLFTVQGKKSRNVCDWMQKIKKNWGRNENQKMKKVHCLLPPPKKRGKTHVDLTNTRKSLKKGVNANKRTFSQLEEDRLGENNVHPRSLPPPGSLSHDKLESMENIFFIVSDTAALNVRVSEWPEWSEWEKLHTKDLDAVWSEDSKYALHFAGTMKKKWIGKEPSTSTNEVSPGEKKVLQSQNLLYRI